MLMPATMIAQSDVSAELAAQNTPDGWTAVALPSIPTITDANTMSIVSYGATEESADNTAAIRLRSMLFPMRVEWLSFPPAHGSVDP